jgi:hypothetical protein
MVTVVGPVPSQILAGLNVPMVGAASTVIAVAVGVAWAPPSSVMASVHVAAAVPAEVNEAVAVVVEVSTTLVKVYVSELGVQTAASEAAPPSLMKFVPVMATVPVAPAPTLLAVAPCGVIDTAVTAGKPAAPATEAIAIGNAAAASKAPAASAFTKWRCILRGLFIVNCSIHKGRHISL